MHQADLPNPPECGGRFEVQAFLGSGGMGAVYEAYDHQRQSQVAIKVIRETNGSGLYRFKQEFRALAGIVHPNLVMLHELIEWEDRWMFTMERVPGVTFRQAGRLGGRLATTAPASNGDTPGVALGADTPPLFADALSLIHI